LKYNDLENKNNQTKESNELLEIANKDNNDIILKLRNTIEDIENKIIVCNNTINDEKENNKKLSISLSELNKELVESKKQNNIRKKRLVNN
jgi:hypothetical protein